MEAGLCADGGLVVVDVQLHGVHPGKHRQRRAEQEPPQHGAAPHRQGDMAQEGKPKEQDGQPLVAPGPAGEGRRDAPGDLWRTEQKQQHGDQPVDEPAPGEHPQVPEHPRSQALHGASIGCDHMHLQGAGVRIPTIRAVVKAMDGAKDRQGNQDEEQEQLADAVVEPGPLGKELLVGGLMTDAVGALEPDPL